MPKDYSSKDGHLRENAHGPWKNDGQAQASES